MLACEEGVALPWPTALTGHEESPTLQECKEACDAASGCRSFSYSGTLKRCNLRERSGEPAHFCERADWSTYWRVDLQAQTKATTSAAAAPSVGSTLAAAAGGGGIAPRRALVRGAQIVDSASGAELRLHGLNVYLNYLRFDDMALMRQLLPSANLVRLVGVFWHDGRTESDCPCCTSDEATGYFAPSCLGTALQCDPTTPRALIALRSAPPPSPRGARAPATCCR